MSAAPQVDPSRDDSFRPLGVLAEPLASLARTSRPGYRVFRGRDGFEAAIPALVVERLVAFARAAAPREWYGLLVGRLCEDEGGRHVLVLGVVPDAGARAEAALVETTHASEGETRALARRLYPDGVILGWCHSHIRYGARYSSTDRANQASWQQAHSLGVVVDPWDPHLLGVYRGPDAELLAPVERVTSEGAAERGALSPERADVDEGPAPTRADVDEGPASTARAPRSGARARAVALLVVALVLGVTTAYTTRTVDAIDARLTAVERGGSALPPAVLASATRSSCAPADGGLARPRSEADAAIEGQARPSAPLIESPANDSPLLAPRVVKVVR